MSAPSVRCVLPGLVIGVVLVLVPHSAAAQACVTNPKISAPTIISPKSGDVISPVYVIKLTADGGSTSGGVNFRWAGSFKSDEKFILEIVPASTTTRAISADAPTTTTRTGTTDPVKTTTTTTTLDANARLISAALGTLVYTTAPGARQHTVDLERGKSYRWRIKAYNCGADAPFSAYTTFSVEAAPITFTNVAPAITSLSPSSVKAGQESPLTLTVNGSNFTSGATVRWNGSNRPTAFVSATRVTATIPASDLAVPSTAQITVSTQATDGGVIVINTEPSGVSAPQTFQVLP